MGDLFHAVKVHHRAAAFYGVKIAKQLMDVCLLCCIIGGEYLLKVIELLRYLGKKGLPEIIIFHGEYLLGMAALVLAVLQTLFDEIRHRGVRHLPLHGANVHCHARHAVNRTSGLVLPDSRCARFAHFQ